MAHIPEGSALAGVPLRALGLPAEVLLMSVLRGDEAIIPDGSTELHVGDRLTVVATEESMGAFKRRLSQEDE